MSDVVLAAIVGGAFGAGGAAIGVLVSWRQDVGRRDRAVAAEREARVRNVRLAALEQTRDAMVDQLDWLQAMVVLRDRSAPAAAVGKRANAHLVGDVEVIREYEDLVRDLSERVPMRWREAMAYWKVRTLAEIDPDDLARISRIRNRVLEAIEVQEMRVLRDEPIATLTDQEVASLAGAEALLDMLRRRTGRS